MRFRVDKRKVKGTEYWAVRDDELNKWVLWDHPLDATMGSTYLKDVERVCSELNAGTRIPFYNSTNNWADSAAMGYPPPAHLGSPVSNATTDSIQPEEVQG